MDKKDLNRLRHILDFFHNPVPVPLPVPVPVPALSRLISSLRPFWLGLIQSVLAVLSLLHTAIPPEVVAADTHLEYQHTQLQTVSPCDKIALFHRVRIRQHPLLRSAVLTTQLSAVGHLDIHDHGANARSLRLPIRQILLQYGMRPTSHGLTLPFSPLKYPPCPPISQLYIPAIKLNLKPKRLLRFRYLSLRILKRFTQPITFSLSARSDAMLRLTCLSFLVKGRLADLLIGTRLLDCRFLIPR